MKDKKRVFMEEKTLIFASKFYDFHLVATRWYHPMTSNGDLESTLYKENSNTNYMKYIHK